MSEFRIEASDKVRVLVVDDSRLIRFAARRMLQGDYDVVLAEDGREGWQRVQQDPEISAVITDLNMPEMDGVELVHRIRNAYDDRIRGLPILVITTVEERDGRQRALDAGANDLVRKPFTQSDLVDPLSDYLSRLPERRASASALPPNIEPTRTGFVQRLQQSASFHRRHGLELSVIHVRLNDYAERVRSDGLNHAEAMMRHLERCLARELRAEDTVGRTRDDTFSILMMATSSIGAQLVASRLRSRLMRNPVRFPGRSVLLDTSIEARPVRCASVVDAHSWLDEDLSALPRYTKITSISDWQKA